jgi:putative transposase
VGVGLSPTSSTWAGFVYVAFVIDTSRQADRRLARQQDGARQLRAGCARASAARSQAGSSKAVWSTTATADRNMCPSSTANASPKPGSNLSVGSVGDSYDNALAETINGLYKAEVIHRRGPWRSFEAVEYATLEWVDWFNHRRLLEPIGNIPPAEAEDQYYAAADNIDMAA